VVSKSALIDLGSLDSINGVNSSKMVCAAPVSFAENQGNGAIAKWWFFVRSRRQGNSPIRRAIARGWQEFYPDSRQVNEVALTKQLLCVVEADAGRTGAYMSRSVSEW